MSLGIYLYRFPSLRKHDTWYGSFRRPWNTDNISIDDNADDYFPDRDIAWDFASDVVGDSLFDFVKRNLHFEGSVSFRDESIVIGQVKLPLSEDYRYEYLGYAADSASNFDPYILKMDKYRFILAVSDDVLRSVVRDSILDYVINEIKQRLTDEGVVCSDMDSGIVCEGVAKVYYRPETPV